MLPILAVLVVLFARSTLDRIAMAIGFTKSVGLFSSNLQWRASITYEPMDPWLHCGRRSCLPWECEWDPERDIEIREDRDAFNFCRICLWIALTADEL